MSRNQQWNLCDMHLLKQMERKYDDEINSVQDIKSWRKYSSYTARNARIVNKVETMILLSYIWFQVVCDHGCPQRFALINFYPTYHRFLTLFHHP